MGIRYISELRNGLKLSKIAAFFDVDGTLFQANAIKHYLYLTTPYIPPLKRWLSISNIIVKIPYYFVLDCIKGISSS